MSASTPPPQWAASPVPPSIPAVAPASQWQVPRAERFRPSPTPIAVSVGGGLLLLAGILGFASIAMVYGSHFLPALFDFQGSALNVLVRWVSLLGGLVIGIVALSAARRHLAAVAAVALVVQLVGMAITLRSYITIVHYPPMTILQLMWASVLYAVALCVLLALALSSKAATPLRVVTLVLFAVVTVWVIGRAIAAHASGLPTQPQVWVSFAASLVAAVGWLVLVVGVRTRFDSAQRLR